MPLNPIQGVEKIEVASALIKRALRAHNKPRAEELIREILAEAQALKDYIISKPDNISHRIDTTEL
jgi:hypothetical protein